MASEWNRGLKTLKRLLEGKIKRLPETEIAYHQYAEHPSAQGLRVAISEINALIEPEES